MIEWNMDRHARLSVVDKQRLYILFYRGLHRSKWGVRLLPKEPYLLCLPKAWGGFNMSFIPRDVVW
jgi:hypothetical protein